MAADVSREDLAEALGRKCAEAVTQASIADGHHEVVAAVATIHAK